VTEQRTETVYIGKTPGHPSVGYAALRYSAVVAASAASLGLTVAAGAYVMNQMTPGTASDGRAAAVDLPARPADAEPPGARTVAAVVPAPVAAVVPAPVTRLAGLSAPAPPTAGQPAAAPIAPAPAAEPPTEPAAEPTRTPGAGRSVDLGVAAVDTHRDERRTTVTLTVDPEVVSVFHGLVPAGPDGDQASAEGASTTLHTEIDRDSGAVAVGFSDPVLGEQSLRTPGADPARPPEPGDSGVSV